MISLAVFILIICSGSVLGCVKGKAGFGQAVPVSCMLSVMLLFLFGIAGFLETGIYVLLVFTVLIYIFSVYVFVKNIKTDGYKDSFRKNFFSFGFFVFWIIVVLAFYCTSGRLVSFWDEFSHWATVVKQMFLTGTISTSPESTFVFFKHYPPGTALFQYIPERLMALIEGKTEFSEWRLYFAHVILMSSFALPLIDKLSFKKIGSYFAAIALLLFPFILYTDAYTQITVDCLIGVISGSALAALVIPSEHEGARNLFVLLSASMLVLTKAAGLLFGVFVAVAYFCVAFDKSNIKNTLKALIFSAGAVLIPKFLWVRNMNVNGVYDEGTAFNPESFLNILRGKEESYRLDVINAFWKVLAGDSDMKLFGINIIYPVLIIASFVCLFLIIRASKSKKLKKIVIILFIQLIVYTFGLLIAYMYHFTAYEATKMFSFSRYMGMAINPILIVLSVSARNYFEEKSIKSGNIAGIVLCVSVLLLCPLNQIKSILTRQSVDETYAFRGNLGDYCSRLENLMGEDESVYLVHQESIGTTYWVSHFIMMPRTVNPLNTQAVHTWSLGGPYNENDFYSRRISPEDWMRELKDTCDYVAIYIINDEFKETYAECFEDPQTMDQSNIFKVNKQTGKLSLVEEVKYKFG